MSQVPLQEYCQEIEGLIEHSAYDEAAAHCRHILQRYPKYIEAYRLMGKVALDREDDKQASELFARVLSADPSDFVSRAGLSIIYDRQGSIKDAVWQMERAYELSPGNPVVQEELRKLYARRDGVEPDKIPLTRGALARLYLNGELYAEAIAELRALLAQEPDRVDLQILLAEALWRDEQRLESADVALKVLDRLPYCLDANLILGEIWTSGGREEDAEVHLKRAQSLDPQAIQAVMLFGESAPIPSQPAELERLDYASPTAAAKAEDQIPEWLVDLGGQAEPTAAEGGEVPAWLQGIGITAPQPQQPPAPEAPVGLKAAAPPIEDEATAWLAGLGTAIAQPQAPGEAAPASVEEAAPDWLSQLRSVAAPEAEAPTVIEEGVPDWLTQLRAEAGVIPGAEVEAAPKETLPPVEETEAMPDWLAQLRAEVTAVPAGELETAPEAPVSLEPAKIPDWLRTLQPQGAEQPAPPAAEAVPDWLAQLRAEAGPVPGAEEAAAESAEVPDWLKRIQPPGAEAAAPVKAAPTEIPEWPAAPPDKSLETKPLGVAPAAPEAEATPAWMTEGGGMPSPEEAMAFFQGLTAGKEVELQAQAEAEAEARMAEIMGAPKPAAESVPPAPTPPPPVTKAEPVTAVPATPAAEPTPAWMTEGGGMPSAEEAMAYFQRLAAGKEVELQAQAQAEADARMAEIMGRPQPTAEPAPPTPTPPPSPAKAEPAAAPAPQPVIPEWLMAQAPPGLITQAPTEAEVPEWLTAPVPFAEEAPPVAPVEQAPSWLTAQPEAPEAVAHAPITPQAVGPEWWYQTLADEEEPAVEELPAAEVAPIFAPPTPEPKPAAPAPKKLIRAKPAPPQPAAPPQPTVDMDALMARLRANPADHDALLGLARGWVQMGNLTTARSAYDELVRAGASVDQVVADLDKVLEDHPDDVEFIRLMGDAQMKTGNLPKALKLYRQALKKL